MKTLRQIANEVCGALPEGWQISIALERDSGDVDLWDEEGEREEFPTNYESLEQQIQDALEHAVERSAAQNTATA